MKILILLLLAVCIFSLSGCLLIWHDDVFICTLLKEVDANDLDMTADPNHIKIGSGDSETNNNKISATAIVGGVPVKVETE